MRKKSHSEGFTIKTKYEKNADKKEGEYSQRTSEEFIKVLFFTVYAQERQIVNHCAFPNGKRAVVLKDANVQLKYKSQ